MIGTQLNNDIYVFFEHDEIEKVRNEKVQGVFIGQKANAAGLEAAVDDPLCNAAQERVVAKSIVNEKDELVHMSLAMRTEYYKKFKDTGEAEHHQGYRHVFLVDAARMDFYMQIIYMGLKGVMVFENQRA